VQYKTNQIADIKPNNILLDQTAITTTGETVSNILLADMEDVCHVPPGSSIIGIQPGNWMWRSPEAHAQGPIGMPSDMFSFGLVVSCDHLLCQFMANC